MWKTRCELEEEENASLAPYAVYSQKSLGRPKKEKPHPYRTLFQRDRARVIHSAAFRRLDGKTQVFLNGTGDHFRTRLTHTIEVASVSRTIARALGLNEDLAETIALAHDLGHPPFGHAGEEKLNSLMKEHGGFDHNVQSLRTVEVLEEKYPRFPGLNLSFEATEGLRKHDKVYRMPDGSHYASPSLEAQVADLADEITYYSHDLDDGIEAGLLDPDKLNEVLLWRDAAEEGKGMFRRIDPIHHRGYIIRVLTNREVDDVVFTSAKRISRSGVRSVDEVRSLPGRLVSFSSELRKANIQLRRFLYKELYHNPAVAEVHRRCCGLLDNAFGYYREHPSALGRKAGSRLRKEGLERTICDYLAGMTDRYLLQNTPGS